MFDNILCYVSVENQMMIQKRTEYLDENKIALGHDEEYLHSTEVCFCL